MNPLHYFGSILRQSQTNVINAIQGVIQTSRQASTFHTRCTVRASLLRPVSDGLQLVFKNVGLHNYTPYLFFSKLKKSQNKGTKSSVLFSELSVPWLSRLGFVVPLPYFRDFLQSRRENQNTSGPLALARNPFLFTASRVPIHGY